MEPSNPPLLRGLTHRPEPSEIALSHRELLGRRLLLKSLVRFGVAAAVVLGGIAARATGLMEPGPATGAVLLGLVVAGYNVPIFVLARRYHPPRASLVAYRPLLGVMYAAIVADYAVLAGLVALMGGARSPFLAFYLLHVTVSFVVLPRRPALAFTLLAYALIAAQVWLEWAGLVHSTLPFPHTVPAAPLDGSTAVEILLAYGTLLGLTAALLVPVVEWLRESEGELRETNERLDQLSRLRRDFLHVAVHNLRTPVGAALAHLDNVSAGLAGPLEGKQQEWIDRSRARLSGLLKLLQDLKTLGDLETERIEGRTELLRLEEVVDDVAREYQEMADAEGILLVPEGERPTPPVRGIPGLLREALANYVTNAIRHAPGTGTVTLRVETVGDHDTPRVRASVADRGPGIAEKDRGRLFREFARGPGAGDTDRPRGAALGLSIVRRIVEAHGGDVGVEPRPGGGSIFFLELPVAGGSAEGRAKEGQ